MPKNAPAKSASKAARKPSQQGSRPVGHPAPGTDRWLFKSEPDAFSWEMQKARGAKGEPWTGVRNYLARNNMRAMKVGDLGFFYHSVAGKEIVGIVEVIKEAGPEPGDETGGTWECVEVRAVTDMPKPVTLETIKATAALAQMCLVTSTRLSVQPVLRSEWDLVCRMGGLDPAEIRRPTPAKSAKRAKSRS